MNSVDIFYRAFTEYKKLIAQDKDSLAMQRFALSLNKAQHENLQIIYYECTIKEDWIIALEKALPFLEKAIKEDRQFIRNNEDILPIEKVRKTSRQSIQDLSKHSDYITRKPDPNNPANITPDKLMVIRKENDYTVYENRVLFTTVMYAKEFIESRLEVIKDAITKYEGKSMVHKKLDIGDRALDIQIQLHETRKNDPYALEKSKAEALLIRIENIFTVVLSFLKMPLLAKFTKVELVKRPITKTNVLKINLNFKNTLALYDYLMDYNELGYTLHRIEESLLPLSTQAVNDYTHASLLLSFITYQYSNRISDRLSKAYFEEEERRQKEREDQLLEQLKSIHLSIKDSGKTLDKYLLMFEEGYRVIEKRVELLKREIRDLVIAQQKEIFQLKQQHELAVKVLNDQHELAVKQINEQHRQDLMNLAALHETEIKELQTAHQQAITSLNEEHETAMEEVIASHQHTLATLQSNMDAKFNALKDTYLKKETDLNKELEENRRLIKEQQEEQDTLQVERDIIKGELLVYKTKSGSELNVDDFTSKERFLELERIRDSYARIFSKSWQATKKAIRKEILSQPYQSPKKEKHHGKKED
jgi:hypothetical protein